MRLAVAAFMILLASPTYAQDPAPKIGPFVVDVHGTVPRFPTDAAQFAASRDVDIAELPGSGLGIQLGAHVYVLKVKAVTIGLGGEFAAGRSQQMPADGAKTSTGAAVRPSEERFSTISPQLSLNFGTGNGWSYLSGGIGFSNWALVPNGQEGSLANSEDLKTLNYGGGARWFAKRHLAFSLDVRFYAISPGTPYAPAGGGPRTTLLVIGAGISLK